YAHFIRHGFDVRDEALHSLVKAPGFRDAVTGVAFTVSRSADAWETLIAVDELAGAIDMPVTAMVRLASDNPASSEHDDVANANRVAQTVAAAHCVKRAEVYLDTFADMDRGYFPRTGLTDRRYNLRTAGLVAKHLHNALSYAAAPPRPSGQHLSAGAAVIELGASALVLPGEQGAWVEPLSAFSTTFLRGADRYLIDLERGEVRPLTALTGDACRVPALILRGVQGPAGVSLPDFDFPG
ncbi:MAG: hypothetical protein ACRDT8_25170, partial [Micromonosporaceae bacterium]